MVFGSKKSNDDSKIIQIIRTWYTKNGKSVDEIANELKEKMGLSDETIREFLIRARILNLPQTSTETAKTSATEALRLTQPPAFVAPSEATSDLTVGKVKSMIDSSLSELRSNLDKRFKLIEESIKDLSSRMDELSAKQEKLEKEIKELNDKLDDRSISSIVNKLRKQTETICDQIDTIKMLMSENYSILKGLKESKEVEEKPEKTEEEETKEDEKLDVDYDKIVNELLKGDGDDKDKEEKDEKSEDDLKKELDNVLDVLKKD